MSLEITCDNCGAQVWVKGYTTLDSWTDPDEAVTDLELVDDMDELCACLEEGESFWVSDEEHETFPDDVI